MEPRAALLTPIIVFTLFGFSYPLHACAANDNYLAIDGRLRVHGASLEGARVTVFHEGRTSGVLTNDVARINMQLDLQSSYLLSFERAGCITKQLLFDTHVPTNALGAAPFSFPFKVTLEAMPVNSTLQYAGPVGLIRYSEAKADFDHDSKYTLVEIDDLLIATLPAAVPTPPVRMHEGLDRMDPIRSGLPEMPRSIIPDRTVSMGLPIAHSDRKETAATRTITGATVTAKASPGIATALPIPKSVRSSNNKDSITRVEDRRTKAPEVLAFADGRMEECHAEKLRVTTVVRITAKGHTTEYRRVAHRYGPVYYFHNGSSCSETTYTAGVGH
ncbi:MAG: hypothetical protein WAU70_03670 [Flavobacteriales bacterium]